MVRPIRLAKDVFAIVDDDDADRVSLISWKVRRTPHTRYAFTTSRMIGKSQQLMHRLILGLKPGQICDHINGNGLDNRRCNLRVVTAEQNARNSFAPALERGKTSRFKGVHRTRSGWVAQINVGGIVDYLGCFVREDDAARVYDEAAKHRFGAYAKTNDAMGLFGVPVDRHALEATGPSMPTPEARDPDAAKAKLHRSRARHRAAQIRRNEIAENHRVG